MKYQGEWRQIVGVARDAKVGDLSVDAQPSIYTPATQRFGLLDLVVRTAGEPAALEPSIREVARQAGPRSAITNIQVMEDLIRASFAEERFRTILVAFGSIAGLLVSIGRSGVTARAVARSSASSCVMTTIIKRSNGVRAFRPRGTGTRGRQEESSGC